MPRYTVRLHQWVEEVADVKVTADNWADAAVKAVIHDREMGADWCDGDGSKGLEPVYILDSHHRKVWEKE